MRQSASPGPARAAALAAALALGCGGAVQATATPDHDLASRFVTAPEAAPDQQQLVQVEVNGIDFGGQIIRVADGKVALPFATMRALSIDGPSGQALDLSSERSITSRFDMTQGTLSLTVPASRLTSRHFAPEGQAVRANLSPETWGAYVNYDVNLRRELMRDAKGATSGPRPHGFGTWGGLADLRVLAPDLVGTFGGAYDGSRRGADALVRLDSTLTWRPAWLNLAVSLGDGVSITTASLAATRPYRFGGLQVGTDFSGAPGWSSSPIPSVTGTAQAQSAIDVYIEGQRTFSARTPGGPFSLVLPPGSTGAGTNVVVTDVTGRSVVIPVEVARVDAQLLRQGVFLWSAGLGVPRFAYGSSLTTYGDKLYGYANVRYGAFNKLTATVHTEGGPGLAELDLGVDMSVTPWLAARASVAASRSARGVGGAGRLGIVAAGPWNLGLEAAFAGTAGSFDDVVSVSGRAYGRRFGLDPLFSLPATSEMSARLSWQPSQNLSLSASYQANTYRGSSPIQFASLNANYLVANRIPVFASLSHAMGRQGSTALLAGVSLSLGSVQASVSGGYGTGSGGLGVFGSGATGSIAAAQPLGEAVGDIGWNVLTTRGPNAIFANADAQVRTGYGVPGLAVQSIGKQVTGYATLRGSAGVVGMHPFLSDPASGGIIIADAGRSGVPLQFNGYDKGRTSWDGKMALTGAVSGARQRVAIDASRLPIDAIPSETDQFVTVRDRGAATVSFGVRSATSSASMRITLDGQPPPVGSTLMSATSSAPISKEGRAYLPSLDRNEVLTVALPDGGKCLVKAKFDGHGGVGRRLGAFPCEEIH